MGKKIEIDIAYLKKAGLSQKQISDIIKNAEPDHWTNRLPEGNHCYEISPFIITPESRIKERVTIYCAGQNDPTLSFFTEEDATFIQNKCRLLVEMSNFAFSVNESWSPDWNDKEIKKYGIVLQNGQAVVKENELFNVFVFGVVINSLNLAKEMLEEFKDRIEIYFAKPFNSVCEATEKQEFSEALSVEVSVNQTASLVTQMKIEETYGELSFIENLIPTEKVFIKRKERKALDEKDVPKIQQMLFNKVQQKTIAEYFGYSEGTVSLLKKRLGFKMKKMPTRIPKEDSK